MLGLKVLQQQYFWQLLPVQMRLQCQAGNTHFFSKIDTNLSFPVKTVTDGDTHSA